MNKYRKGENVWMMSPSGMRKEAFIVGIWDYADGWEYDLKGKDFFIARWPEDQLRKRPKASHYTMDQIIKWMVDV